MMKRDLNTFQSQHFSQLSWAYASLGISDTALFDRLAAHWMAQDTTLATFSCMQLVTVCWAFGTMQHSHVALFDKLVAEMIRRCV